MLADPRLPGVEVLHAHYVRHQYAPHWHDAVCLAAVTNGDATFDCGRDNYLAPPASVFVIPPLEVHTGGPTADAGWDYWAVYIDPCQFGDLLERSKVARRPGLALRRGELVRKHTAALGPLLRFHQAMATPTSTLELEHTLVTAVGAVAVEYGASAREPAPTREHSAVRRAKDHLLAHATEEITLSDLANVSGLSVHRLAHVFKAKTGLPPHAYQTQLRVLRAKRLLATGLPIAAVATDCGFYDQAHLTTVFKRHLGVTPGAYVRSTSD